MRGTVAGVDCVYTDYVGPASADYGAHTQLARIAAGPRGEGGRSPGSRDAEFAAPPDVDVTVLPVPETGALAQHFAGGPGAVHIYGLEHPLPR